MHNDDVLSVGRLHGPRAQPALQVAGHSPHAHLGNEHLFSSRLHCLTLISKQVK